MNSENINNVLVTKLLNRLSIVPLFFIQCLLLPCILAYCWLLSVPIEGRLQIPGNSKIPTNYEITLNGDEYTTFSKVDGSFIFHDIPSGVYLLDVAGIIETYPQMKLKISAENGTVNVVEYKYPGAKRIPASYPMIITAVAKPPYFKKKTSFSLLGLILGNPMMAIMGVIALIMFTLPNLLSPEELKEFKQQQQQQATNKGDPMKELSKLMGVNTPKGQDDDDEE